MSLRRWFALVAGLTLLVLAACADGAPAASNRLTFDGRLIQGGLVVGRTVPGAKVTLDGRPVRVAKQGLFVIGFGRDARPTATLELTLPDGTVRRRTLKIARRVYKVQRIDGLPRRKVTPSAEDLKRIRREGARIRAARAADTATPWFAGGFAWPARGIVSGVYGSQRILNGQPRSPHAGVDVAAPTGTKVVATADGRIALADRAMFYTGHTVMIDHGHGVTSIYAHLSEISVTSGQRIKKGAPIGRIGATGRVTGPHLHWGLSLFGTRLDPALLVGPMEK